MFLKNTITNIFGENDTKSINKKETMAPIFTTFEYVKLILLMIIPVFGLFFSVVLITDKTCGIAIKNLAKAMIIVKLIIDIVIVLIAIFIVPFIIPILTGLIDRLEHFLIVAKLYR